MSERNEPRRNWRSAYADLLRAERVSERIVPQQAHQAEVCLRDGGRVRVETIPHGRPKPPEAPPIGCVGCSKRVEGGEGFFVEVDDMKRRGWGVYTQVVCGPCMADAMRPRNIIAAVREEDHASSSKG